MNILIQPSYGKSHWCTHYLRGIEEIAKRKRIKINIFEQVSPLPDEVIRDPYVLVLCASILWAERAMQELHAAGVRPIILTLTNQQKEYPYASFISMDYADASRKLIDYLTSIGKEKIALIAVSKNSSTDALKIAAFENNPKIKDAKNSLFTFDGKSLRAICDEVIEKLDRFNAIICSNDIVAAVLVRRLIARGVRVPDDVHIATFGDTVLSSLQIRNVTIAKIRSAQAAELAISAYNLLRATPNLSSLSMLISCDVLTADDNYISAKETPAPAPVPVTAFKPGTNFFSDPDVSEVMLVEKLLSHADELDIKILRAICNKESYSKISARLFIAENTISYRVKKIFSAAPEKSKQELFDLLSQFL